MLPDALVEQAGLGLHDTSPALSISLDLDEDGNADAVDVQLTTVRVQRLTYTQAQERLNAGAEPFVTLARLAAASRELRVQEGALSIDLPEVRVKADETGATVTPLPKPEMRVVVQECMTLAGWGAAIYADDHAIALPFATQDPPHREVCGDTLAAQWARRRTLARTRFQPAPGPHAGMGLDLYTQATSPMRRYLDLVVHQQLRAHLAGQDGLSGKEVAARVAQAQMNADATRQAERLSRRHHTLRFIAAQPEREWEAVVVDRRGRRRRCSSRTWPSTCPSARPPRRARRCAWRWGREPAEPDAARAGADHLNGGDAGHLRVPRACIKSQPQN